MDLNKENNSSNSSLQKEGANITSNITNKETKVLTETNSTNDTNSDLDKQTKEDSTSGLTGTQEGQYSVLEDDSLLPWKACWDNQYQCYYYWNTETNETTYELPTTETTQTYEGYYDTNYNRNDATVDSNNITSQEYDYYMQQETIGTSRDPLGGYGASAHFNARTGKFQADPTKNPEHFSYEAKHFRQCGAFFDYDNYMEQRGTELQRKINSGSNRKTKITGKILEKLKQRRKEKKLEAKKKWLLED